MLACPILAFSSDVQRELLEVYRDGIEEVD